MIKVINLKANNNSGDYAELVLEQEIINAPKTGTRVIIAIHGYGSSGTGGVIKMQVHDFLARILKFKKIKAYVKGEQWTDLNETVQQMQKLFPELILHNQIQRQNSGVTIIWIY